MTEPSDARTDQPKPDARGTAPPLIRAQPPSLPTGGGAIRGIGEKFSANAATGTGSLVVPLPVTPARGAQPELSLRYESGSGSGPFGAGWRLSVPGVTRKTDKQLPTYLDADGADTFVMSGAEDLVPSPGGPPGIARYRPRVEGGFVRIERHLGADPWWSSTTGANVRSVYGQSPDARVADPDDPRRVFSWLLERTEDASGNVTTFEYVAEDLAHVAASPAERHRLDGSVKIANRYLKRVRYGNTTPGDDSTCVFQVVFDYGDHAGDSPDPTPGLWPARADAFSSYRAGFDLRTYRLCRRVMLFHSLPELGPAPCLVRSVAFTYDGDSSLAHLVAIEERGYVTSGAQTETLTYPALLIGYTVAAPSGHASVVTIDGAGDLPGGVDGARDQWVDLDAEGIPGVLSDADGGLYFRRNLGGGLLGPARPLSTRPSVAQPAGGVQQLLDIGGDGRLDLVDHTPPAGFHERIPAGDGDGDWESFQIFASHPEIEWSDPNVRFLDLDGDGLDDVLVTRDDAFVWYPSLGKSGWGPPRTLPRPSDDERGPAVVFADVTRSIVLADLSGDGLRDLVRVENGAICYWPNLGQGKFGAQVTMSGAPVFDAPDQFEARRVLFADVDGTGTADVLYAGRDGVRYWLNQAGNGFGPAHDVEGLPPDVRAASVTAVDLLGTGTACVVWSSPAPGDRGALRYVDLTGGIKPHLLASVDNQLGFTTRVQYAPSTKFYLADRAAGVHWKTQLGFPVQVIERVETYDAIRRLRFVSEYAYRDGYFDGYEREFRGFGYVEQRDTESDPAPSGLGLFPDRPPAVNGELPQPPVVTRTWFHTGVWLDLGPDGRITVEDGLTTAESRDAFRALRGLPLRQEIAADDGTPLAALPYSATTNSYHVARLQPAVGDVNGVFVAQAREVISSHYERDLSDPRVRHELTIEVDEYNHPRRVIAIGYPRRAGAADARPEQLALLATLTESDVANEAQHDDWYRIGVPLETRSYQLNGLAKPGGDAILAFDDVKKIADAAKAIAYDAPIPPGASKRLVERARTRYYDTAALPAPLAFGAIDARALGYESYGLAFTPSLLATLYGARATDAILAEGGYCHLDDPADPDSATGWWVRSGRSLPDPSRFFLPVEYHDPFGNPPAKLAYDPHRLVVQSLSDARGNTTTATIDYRTLSPSQLTDPNGNQSQIATDALGRVLSLWVMGNPARSEGDRPPAEPTVKFDYAFYDAAAGRPSVVHSAARETHGDPSTRWQHTYSYSDGTGREVMKKVQAEPGQALALVGGQCVAVDANPRWLGTGRAVFDNKGNPIKQYVPYFSATSDFEDEAALVCAGVTPILHYDPLGRLILTEHPDGSFARVAFTPWRQTSYDANDTSGDAGNLWAARGQASADAAVRRAAALTLAHANTPAVTLFDSLGRGFSAITDNQTETFETRSTLDIEGNPLVITDPLGRQCMIRAFNIAGQACRAQSIDGGDRRTLADVAGQPLRRWDRIDDTNDRVTRPVYDNLRRAIEVHAQVGAAAELLAERTIYGEDAPADPAANRLARVYQHYDGAGVATSAAYDFKGNLLSTERQLVSDYHAVPDWSQAPALDGEVFRASTVYDALDRTVEAVASDGSIVRPRYNEAGLLDGVDAQLRGAAARTSFVANVDYNVQGKRSRIVYGDAAAPTATTTYSYDPITFRLATLTTTRAAGPLQDLAYTYDATGNVVQIGDAIQTPVFYDGGVVDGTARYVYDPTYRLTTAQGREHAGGFAAPPSDEDVPVAPLPHPNDGQSLIAYEERYSYDAVGNLQTMTHGPPGAAPAWTSPRSYAPGTNRLAATMTTGDDPADPAHWHGLYQYDPHGNTTAMPHLARLDWDWKDQLQRADKGGGGAVYFTYDSSGARVRKVWEHNGTIDEHIYLGGYEIYRQRKSGAIALERQTLHVMDGKQRIAMVETKTIDTSVAALTPAPVARYQLGNHLGSVAIELDTAGDLISYEEYHPFGTSAYRAASAIEVSKKRYRHVGKERDEETSLEYGGARYYAPWLARWIAADPTGLADGVNLYWYCQDSPTVLHDPNGTQSWCVDLLPGPGQGSELIPDPDCAPKSESLFATPPRPGSKTKADPPPAPKPKPKPKPAPPKEKPVSVAELTRIAESRLPHYHYSENTERAFGAGKATLGIIEMGGGLLLSETVVGGVVLGGQGFDDFITGMQTIKFGKPQESLKYKLGSWSTSKVTEDKQWQNVGGVAFEVGGSAAAAGVGLWEASRPISLPPLEPLPIVPDVPSPAAAAADLTKASAPGESAAALDVERLGGQRIFIAGPEGPENTRAIRIIGDEISYDTTAPANAGRVRQDMKVIRNILQGEGKTPGRWYTGTHGSPTGEFGGAHLEPKFYLRERGFGPAYGWEVVDVGKTPSVPFGKPQGVTVYNWCFSSQSLKASF